MSIFERDPAVAALRSNQLALAGASRFQPSSLSDDYLWSKILSAEKEAQRNLRVFFEPTEIFPESWTQEDIDALPEGMPWAEEPGYDYDPDFFHGERWGMIVTRQKPIIKVSSIRFFYPAPTSQVFAVPIDWVRMDKKYGVIRLVPASQAFYAPLGAFLMQALGAGRIIPHMMHVRYTAGLQNVTTEYPDLINVIYRMATLEIMKDAFINGSESISGDGLSQSRSTDLSALQDSIDKTLRNISDQIHGIRCMVF